MLTRVRPDLPREIVAGLLLLELKAVPRLRSTHLLVNFDVPILKGNISRVVR